MSSYQDRAKQFLPYASLRGFDEVVARKRRIREPRRELVADAEEELSEKLSSLSEGTLVSVTYYRGDAYITRAGRVSEIDVISRTLMFEDFTVPLDDIFSLEF